MRFYDVQQNIFSTHSEERWVELEAGKKVRSSALVGRLSLRISEIVGSHRRREDDEREVKISCNCAMCNKSTGFAVRSVRYM
jgi:hypothetical protein